MKSLRKKNRNTEVKFAPNAEKGHSFPKPDAGTANRAVTATVMLGGDER